MEKQNNIRYTLNIALRLLLICGAVALLLALINNFTAPVTAEKEAAEKQKKLDWLSRALIVLFLGVLAVTMYNIYFAG